MLVIRDFFSFFFSYCTAFNLILGINYCWLTRFDTLLLLQTSRNGKPVAKGCNFLEESLFIK